MKKKEHFHFIGIGGVGMSALAYILLEKGEKVTGSDKVDSHVLQGLRAAGATIFIGQSEENIVGCPKVVYSTAIKGTNPEFAKAKESGCQFLHRSDLLELLLGEKKALVVAGSHGKTTTSSLLAYTLTCCNMMPTYVIGGFSDSLKHNGSFGSGDYFVAEGDESDGSFLKSSPIGGILTNIDFDHIGYYWKDRKELLEAFQTFAEKMKDKKLFFYCGDDRWLQEMQPKGVTYGLSKGCEVRGSNVSVEEGQCVFDITYKGIRYDDMILNMIGEHNVLNALGVFGLAMALGADPDDIRLAFESFGGVKRRFEWKGEENGITVYDDYAHHPNEIKAAVKAGIEIARGRRVIPVFQPHRYTRLNDLMDEFAAVLREMDNLIVTDLYSAGEPAIAGATTEALIEKIDSKNVTYCSRDRLVDSILEIVQNGDIVITLGAGDITAICDELLSSLRSTVRQ